MAFEVGDKVKYQYGGDSYPYSLEGEVVAVTSRSIKVRLPGRKWGIIAFTMEGIQWGYATDTYWPPCIKKIEKELGTTEGSNDMKSEKRIMRKDMDKVSRAVLDHMKVACDYCTNPKMVKVTVHNHYWVLCYDCALEHAKRFELDINEIHKIAKKNGITLTGEGA